MGRIVNRNHPLKAWKVRRPSHMNPRRPVRTVDRHASENHSHTAHDSPPPPQHMTDPQGGSGTANRVVGNADTGSNGACANFFTGFNFRAGFIRSGGPRLAIGNLDSAATALPAAIWGSGQDFKIDFATLPGGAPRFPPPVAPMLPRFRWACTEDLTPHGMSSMMIPSNVWELRGAVARDAAALAARYVRRRRAERYLGVAHAGSPDRERGRRPIPPPPPTTLHLHLIHRRLLRLLFFRHRDSPRYPRRRRHRQWLRRVSISASGRIPCRSR